MELFPKQLWAFHLLTDGATKEIGFGGAAGGGKSYLGCYWLQVMASELNGSRWFIGRDSLKDTRDSVLFTMNKVSKELGFKNWEYKNDDRLYFANGSTIDFLDLSFYPKKDPYYERFGSKEYTAGWIEEAGPVHELAYEVLKTRVGRWFNAEYGVIGKVLVTFNPKKGWLFNTFYTPFKRKTESTTIKFIPALYSDNPKLTPDYVNALLAIKDKATRERLLHGNFEYEDDPTDLITYDAIVNIWHNFHVAQPDKKCITADIARFGSDKAIIMVWYGFKVVEYHTIEKSKITYIQQLLNALRRKHHISRDLVVADEDGVGGGVVDNCNIMGFVNNSKAYDDSYYNIKTECGYLLAELIQCIHFDAEVSLEDKADIEEELGCLKTYKADEDGKLRILPKVEIKKKIGRSPDWLDNFIMRMVFEIVDFEGQQNAYDRVLSYLG